MAMAVGDKFSILEVDKGDGWTRILKDEVDGWVDFKEQEHPSP